MNIFVNGKKLEVSGQRLLIEELREAGYDIPSLCYAADARHEPSCMVCMVRNEDTDQMLPSCAIYPSEGMRIDATSDEVTSLRRMSLELLLSDHRADCEAPCTLVCPAGIDVAKVINYYDEGRLADAKALLLSNLSNPSLPMDATNGSNPSLSLAPPARPPAKRHVAATPSIKVSPSAR